MQTRKYVFADPTHWIIFHFNSQNIVSLLNQIEICSCPGAVTSRRASFTQSVLIWKPYPFELLAYQPAQWQSRFQGLQRELIA